ncbi:MAG: translocation/assembly module TamB [Gemmatimonadota bacterium]|nr:translocation/assembly module TamB [Gemmatimonadota bacterium]
MSRRLRVVIASASVLLALGLLVVIALVSLTHTRFGQDRVRSLVESMVKGKVKGKIHIGRISGGFFNGATIDSLEIRDDEDSLFVATGPIRVTYDVRDLFDRRILLGHASVEHPKVVLRQHEDGEWNWRRVFPAGVQKNIRNARGFGDFIVLDSADVNNADVRLTLPWHPAEWLRGKARDSTIAADLSKPDPAIRRTREGFSQTWRWTKMQAKLGYVRIADPDSAGRFVVVRSASVDMPEPPFRFRNVSGNATHLGDSLWVNASHWDLPGSTGHAKGKIVWGSDLPIRYQIHVRGDSVSMSDVAWVYPTLPTTGGGTMDLDIRTPKDFATLDYTVWNMDVRSTRSHLTGHMTFATGGPILIVKDVALKADPVNFDLLRTLNGKKFPYDWQGNITGTVTASGGPLTHFRIEQSALTFADAHVPGAVTKAKGHGELDILFPALTAFHSFDVGVETLDLRTLQYLNPLFPRLKGTVSGVATLDSSWLDVRFRNALLVHHDGNAPESRASGSGRVTWGKLLTYDLKLNAEPLSFTTLARSYPGIPLRGDYSGPMQIVGTSPNLRVVTTLNGAGGTLAYDGTVDSDAPIYEARGIARTTNADLRTLFANAKMPVTRLNTSSVIDVRGSSANDIAGALSVELSHSSIGDLALDPSRAILTIGNGRIRFDTLSLRAASIVASAAGTISLADSAKSELRLRVRGDSIGSALQLLPPSMRSSFPDSLHGAFDFAGSVTSLGTRMDIGGKLRGTDLGFGSKTIGTVLGDFGVADLRGRRVVNADLGGKNVNAGLVHFDSARVFISQTVSGPGSPSAAGGSGDFHGDLSNRDGVNVLFGGRFTTLPDTTRVELSRLDVMLDKENTYGLGSAARLAVVPGAVLLDSLVLRHGSNARLIVDNLRLSHDSIRGRIRTDSVDISLFRALLPTLTQAHGGIVADVDVRGSVKQPQLFGHIDVADASASLSNLGTKLQHIRADVELAGDSVHIKRLSAETNKERRGTVSVDGEISFERYDNPGFSLNARAENSRAIDAPGLASLDVSTGPAVTLTGSYRAALLRGTLRVERGTIYIPDLIRKNVVDLTDPEFQTAVDTILSRNREVLPKTPRNLAKNLTLENVRVQIGQDVWLRSSEANIKLGGSLDVALGPGARAGDASQLTLEGTLSADRGTYRLNLVDPFVQPTFDVESGTLRFFGTPDLNPSLDIRAIHTVRQPRQSANGRDVRVRVTIGGTLSNPQLALDNPDNLPLSESDLLSYLVTGAPAIGFNNSSSEYGSQLARAALQYGGTLLSNAIPKNILDIVELQTASVGGASAAERAANPYYYNLLNTRAILGKQIGSKWFLSLSTGLCFTDPTFFKENLGLQLEYRISSVYSAQAGLEPGSSDAVCHSTAVRSLQPTPPQFGIDFFRNWRF